MPRGFVKITNQTGRDIFMNGNYAASAGAAPGPFDVETGLNTFETLDANLRVDNRRKVITTHTTPNHAVDLDPVEPPQPTT